MTLNFGASSADRIRLIIMKVTFSKRDEAEYGGGSDAVHAPTAKKQRQ